MFSSSNIDNPFSQLHTSFHVSSPLFSHNGDNMFLHNHEDDLIAGHFLPAANTPATETVNNTMLSTNGLNGNHRDLLPRKKPLKKDRHSKIVTAQGPRDRRVRLSIEISRKFFHLQDMLGFDKASKTIDWLLTNSKTAIKEMVQLKQSSSGDAKSLSFISELCEVVSGNNEAENQGKVSKGRVNKEKSMDQKNKIALNLLARESRAKARARARERTRELLRIRELNKSKEFPGLSPLIPDLSTSWNQLEACEKLGSNSQNMLSTLKVSTEIGVNEGVMKNIIEESIVIRRTMKASPVFSSQQNLTIPKDLSSPNSSENFDISSTIRRSSFYATNPSTGLQTLAKSWELGLQNYCQHRFGV